MVSTVLGVWPDTCRPCTCTLRVSSWEAWSGTDEKGRSATGSTADQGGPFMARGCGTTPRANSGPWLHWWDLVIMVSLQVVLVVPL